MRILLLVLLATVLAWADPRSEIARVMGSGYDVQSVRVSGDYALATVGYARGEGEGTYLFRRLEGRWHRLGGGGGALGPRELYLLGAPPASWKGLYGVAVQTPLRDHSPGWPETSQKRLSAEDLNLYSPWELTLMRNEIFARHGKLFKDPLLREYFASRPWYRPNPAFADSQLSRLESANAQAIWEYQESHHKQF